MTTTTPTLDDATPYFGIDVPFMRHIGLRPVALTDEACRTDMPLQFALTNSRGDVHGGAMMSAFDFTLSAAARAHDPLRHGVITLEMSTHFYAPGRTDLSLVARCTRRGKSIAFCEGEIVDASGTRVAAARATFKLIALKP